MKARALAYGGLGEFKVVSIRETPPDLFTQGPCDCPERAAAYWAAHIRTDARFNPEVETLWVIALNVRRRVIGCYLVSTGSADTCYVPVKEVLKPAVVASASGLIVMHNHPSGDSTPSEADIMVTRKLSQAGKLLEVDILDHVIMGDSRLNGRGWHSLRELGYFCN